jgi:hypothetical protein
MPKKAPNKERKFAVGDRIEVSLRGQIVEGTIKAIIDKTDGKRFQVALGKDRTALVHLWRVVKD